MSTPVQRQYWELKNQNPEALLFFRLGDFYELFYQDAEIAAKLLGLALTARHRDTDNEMTMCGFPHHSHTEYLEKLIQAGYKVAIAEQVEDEDGKIKRVIDRLVTPGTSLESGTLDPAKSRYLTALGYHPKQNQYCLASSDLSTGELRTCVLKSETAFWEELARLSPAEIIFDENTSQNESFIKRLPQVSKNIVSLPKKPSEILAQSFNIKDPKSLGIPDLQLLWQTVASLIQYLEKTQNQSLKNLQNITTYDPDEGMLLDEQTFRHLEIFQSIYSQDRNGTLWSVLHKPTTAMGNRCLRKWLIHPLQNLTQIQDRQTSVQILTQDRLLHTELQKALRQIPDLERILSRLTYRKGNARDLKLIDQGLTAAQSIRDLLVVQTDPFFQTHHQAIRSLQIDLKKSPELKKYTLNQTLTTHTNLKISDLITDNPPLEIQQGGMIKPYICNELDHWRSLSQDADAWLENYLEEQKQATGLSNIRVKYSKNFGYTLEVSKAQSESAPAAWTRRQTLVNAERFTTPELSEFEAKSLQAESEIVKIEYDLFLTLRDQVLDQISQIQSTAQAIAQIDALQSLAQTGYHKQWVLPTVSEIDDLKIKDGRHPVVETIVSPYIANDCHMPKNGKIHLITGPNMAGKSTFLRQNALIIYLAHIGSPVPASKAQIPLTDRIYTRVGSADNLAGGQSTFYVEMLETARILRQATSRSFVILDEIGRGTSTYDGMSLAWAITEHLHDEISARTLFATHYHELIGLGEKLPHAQNYHVAVAQKTDGLLFLHQIKPGGMTDSFGIEVAHQAGVPASVVQKAREVLWQLEQGQSLNTEPNLFTIAAPAEKIIEVPKPSAVEEHLKTINPDEMSPKQALEQIYELYQKL